MVLRRLLLVTSNFGGGTGAHLVSMLDRVDPRAWRIEILCQGLKELEPPEHVSLLDGAPRSPMHRFPLAQVAGLRQLRRRVLKGEPNVVHTYFFWPIIYGRILKRMGLIRHLVENREDQGFNLSTRNYRILKATSGLPNRVICVSEAVRQVVLERESVEEARTTVIHNGVELPELTATTDRRDVLRELGFSPENLIVGMVANLNRAVKGVGYFVEAMPLILREVPDARFLILGGGPDEEVLRSRTEELDLGDRVFFAGFQPDVERYYLSMDVSVLTSLSEGLSMTLLESMSFGLPVVATRVGGNPEVIREGETGFLVPARDPAAFAHRVVELLTNRELRERMGQRGRRVVEEEFTLSQTAARYQEVYEDVIR